MFFLKLYLLLGSEIHFPKVTIFLSNAPFWPLENVRKTKVFYVFEKEGGQQDSIKKEYCDEVLKTGLSLNFQYLQLLTVSYCTIHCGFSIFLKKHTSFNIYQVNQVTI